MDIEKAIDGYQNDGYVYCIKTNSFIEDNQIVKIGKIGMKESEESTLSTLLNRYSTYHPNCVIYKSVRVSNHHDAEKYIFELLKDIHYKKEHFYFDEHKIEQAFDLIKTSYPDINTVVLNSDINTVSNLNKQIRHQMKN
jgi:S-adenosylmethionine synthetase